MTSSMIQLPRFSFRDRSRILGGLTQAPLDVLIIGGGITGAGVFRDLITRDPNLRIGLIEANDFAYGTSSRSTKLIHGGIRYLENFEFRLVFESVSERRKLQQVAGHLIKPRSFVVPIYRGSRLAPWKMSIGLWLYDALALFRNVKNHVRHPLKRLKDLEPALNKENIEAVFEYVDCQTDDSRLTLENIVSGYESGGMPLSYMEFLDRSVNEDQHLLNVRDRLTDKIHQIKATVVLNATGPWNEKVLQGLGGKQTHSLKPTKGTHIVFSQEKLPVKNAILINSAVDGRVMFVIPWREYTVVGTTDTLLQNKVSDDQVTLEDVDYLLESVRGFFETSKDLSRKDIISSWVGIRPLLSPEQGSSSESQISREHAIWETPKNILHVAGGKLTTYRLMSEQITDKILRNLGKCKIAKKCMTEYIPLPGFQEKYFSDRILGCRWSYVEKLIKEDAMLGKTISNRTSVCVAQVIYHIFSEMSLSVADVMVRRTSLYYQYEDGGHQEAEEISQILKKYLEWSEEQRKKSLQEYLAWCEKTNSYRNEPISKPVAAC